MPYNTKVFNLLGTKITGFSDMPLGMRFRGALAQGLMRKKPSEENARQFSSFIIGTSVDNSKTGTYAEVIGLDALNILAYPYCLIQITKMLLFAGLDSTAKEISLELDSKRNLSTDMESDTEWGKYLRIPLKALIQLIAFIPELIFFGLAKCGDFIGNGIEAGYHQIKSKKGVNEEIVLESPAKNQAPAKENHPLNPFKPLMDLTTSTSNLSEEKSTPTDTLIDEIAEIDEIDEDKTLYEAEREGENEGFQKKF